ncbi:hypothetical protein C8F01DRAFT_1254119 [Mycena amicta]|nr:hypothetical protein C8F01DRAFT_1254119 [Mycena amicta]
MSEDACGLRNRDVSFRLPFRRSHHRLFTFRPPLFLYCYINLRLCLSSLLAFFTPIHIVTTNTTIHPPQTTTMLCIVSQFRPQTLFRRRAHSRYRPGPTYTEGGAPQAASAMSPAGQSASSRRAGEA